MSVACASVLEISTLHIAMSKQTVCSSISHTTGHYYGSHALSFARNNCGSLPLSFNTIRHDQGTGQLINETKHSVA